MNKDRKYPAAITLNLQSEAESMLMDSGKGGRMDRIERQLDRIEALLDDRASRYREMSRRLKIGARALRKAVEANQPTKEKYDGTAGSE